MSHPRKGNGSVILSMARRAMRRCRHLALAVGGIALFASVSRAEAPAGAPTAESTRFFEEKVRPVLATQCMKCHGDRKQEASLRLDSREAVLKGSDSGPVVIPGEPAKSPLLSAVRHEGDVRMPPGKPLPPADVASLTEWVRLGAPWPKAEPVSSDRRSSHWAFQPVRRRTLPPVRGALQCQTFVDPFILERLEASGLGLSPPADRRALLRRVTFDLIGLPPTPAEVEAFCADSRPDAYERVVDRLLASPRYGERWARYWMDLARYADTKAYVFTQDRSYRFAYTYRDWLIDSWNSDKPYDQFLLEQLAADRTASPGDARPLAAMGFLTLGRRYLNDPHEIIDDRIDVIGRGLLGLSLSCARCHDHKYDPISMEDYYSLYGIFASSTEPADLPPLPRRVSAASLDYDRRLSERERQLADYLAERRRAAQTSLARDWPAYASLAHEVGLNAKHPDLGRLAEKEKLSPELATWFVPRWQERVLGPDGSGDPIGIIRLANASEKDWQASASRAASAKFLPPAIRQSLRQSVPKNGRDWFARLAELDSKGLVAAEPRWAELRGKIAAACSVSDGDVEAILDASGRTIVKDLRGKIEAIRARHPGQPPKAMVLVDAEQPADSFVFVRGNPHRRGKTVPRRPPELFASLCQPVARGSGRLELARAIAHPGNPLTARVMVNRVWMHHFGTGLVATPGDFGLRGDAPSHPELLDELAGRFVQEGWSIKKLQRWIILSATYRQHSADRPELASIDPENRLLGHFPRRRLDFEAMRDAMLASASRLDPSIGGPSTPLDRVPYTGRRTLYGFVDRQNIANLFRTFDVPNPNIASPRRFQTTTPVQALYLMNSPFVATQARALAKGLPVDRNHWAAGIDEMYQRAFQRPALPREKTLALAYLESQSGEGPAGASQEWQYGYGEFDSVRQRVRVFHHFAHWSGDAWRPEATFPHPTLGHAQLTASGGHPARGDQVAVIRRWTAPRDLTLLVTGKLDHAEKAGDGIRGRIVSSRFGELGSWVVSASSVATTVAKLTVQAGDTLDFITDSRQNNDFDSFSWTIRLEAVADRAALPPWESSADFAGPKRNQLAPWESLAQALLASNEFVYVD